MRRQVVLVWRVLELRKAYILRLAQNVPCSTFEAQEKQFWQSSGGLCGAKLSKAAAGLLRVLRPGQNVPCRSCSVSKPNRKSL